jgi:hypothetical protein
MEKRLDATLAAVQAVQPALTKFCNSLSDEQKAPLQCAPFGVPADGVTARRTPVSGLKADWLG